MTQRNTEATLRVHSAIIASLNRHCPESTADTYEVTNNTLAIMLADYIAETFSPRHHVAGLECLRDVFADAATALRERTT